MSLATVALLAASTALAAPTAAPPELSGTWAVELTLVSAATIPVLGSVDSTTVTTGRMRTIATERGVTQRYEICDVTVEDRGAIVTSSIPDAFVEALPIRTVSPWAEATDEGWRYRVELGSTHVGYDPGLSGGRPTTDAEDPATIDSDGDGAPGATVMVSVPLFSDVSVHITQGSRLALDGTWLSDDLVHGRAVTSYLEQNVVGASNRLFARSPSIRPDNDESSFTLVRVPDGASCSELPALMQAARGSAAAAAIGTR